MKKVITFGVFDYFHLGHLRLFQNARALGDYLIVAVQAEESILKYKPQAKIFYSTQQRVELISSLKYVDEVVIYHNVDEDVQTFHFDIFAIGEDQTHSGFAKAVDYCNQNNKQVVRMKRTPGISSSDIKKQIE